MHSDISIHAITCSSTSNTELLQNSSRKVSHAEKREPKKQKREEANLAHHTAYSYKSWKVKSVVNYQTPVDFHRPIAKPTSRHEEGDGNNKHCRHICVAPEHTASRGTGEPARGRSTGHHRHIASRLRIKYNSTPLYPSKENYSINLPTKTLAYFLLRKLPSQHG